MSPETAKGSHDDKPYSPGSLTDPRKEGEAQNPTARETLPGGAGSDEQKAAAKGGGEAKKAPK